MHDVFEKIRGLLKLDNIIIDNIIFRFHYKGTMVILMTFSLLVTCRQYFGDPIDCIVEGVNRDTIDIYCWFHSTFTLPSLTDALKGEVVPHPGVANHLLKKHEKGGEGGEGIEEEGEDVFGDSTVGIRHHKYYQWVTLFLFLQAVMFYLPRYIWKWWEAGRLRMLVDRLNQPTITAEVKQERMNTITGYFVTRLHRHNIYAYQFFTCELLNFFNVIGQMYFTNRFLDFAFMDYGPRVHRFETSRDSRYDPMEEIFPKVAKCIFHKFGPGGSIMRHDALCVLPLNILNQKIFVFLWFWFLIVALLSAIGLLYRAATFYPNFRHLLLRGRSRLASAEDIKTICEHMLIGDWFLMYLMAKNMDPFAFKDFVNELAPKIVDKHPKY